ncbi:M16 family metallopeptidase [Clostridium sp. Cult3]|uniref:M16 family metallopeptidase n=1 Tax=Clostridium sp. Cult3 TaxID=2079004 RepID=UPI001F1C54AA|nr:pitrilysin family protein [Clostridium sp. Cult3]MCF6459887.1 peptidase M16 [Clostridium sp. Cult3]
MYIKEKLNNGIRVVMEEIPYVNSVSIGVLVNNGSIKEKDDLNGISHFIEHMLFKGTSNRSAKELAESIDDVGGQINAFTGTEYTCFYVRVLDKHLPIAIDVLSDMLNNSTFGEKDIEKEKGVIIEEINMYLDSPEDIVYDILSETMFENTSLALPILGTYETVSNLDRDTIMNYYKRHYTTENIVISIVGNFQYRETIAMLNECFYKTSPIEMGLNDGMIEDIPEISQNIGYKLKDTEQLNLCVGMEGVKRGSDDIYPLLVMNNTFGGSMSSRLFQRLREEMGLVYSVYSHPTSFENIGAFTVYAGLSVNQILNVAKLVNEDIEDLKDNLITDYELFRSKEQLKGNYILGMESTSNRMFEIGKSELLLNKVLSPEDILNKIDKVQMVDIERVVTNIFNRDKYNIAYVGKLSDPEKINNNLKEIFFS